MNAVVRQSLLLSASVGALLFGPKMFAAETRCYEVVASLPKGIFGAYDPTERDGFFYAHSGSQVFKVAKDQSAQFALIDVKQGEISSIALDLDGTLYGTIGGAIFKVDPDFKMHSLLRFPDAAPEFWPATVMPVKDGFLYGCAYGRMADWPNAEPKGFVFRCDKNGRTLTAIHVFGGEFPEVPVFLMRATDGFLYGTTERTIFRMKLDGSQFAVLRDIGKDGMEFATGLPFLVSLLEDGPDYLCGSAATAIFRMNKAGGEFRVLRRFIHPAAVPGQTQPEYPGCLSQGEDGKLYGITSAGGANESGTAFSLGKEGSDYTVLHDWGETDGSPTDQGHPAALIKGDNGALYGATSLRACACEGSLAAIFKLSPEACKPQQSAGPGIVDLTFVPAPGTAPESTEFVSGRPPVFGVPILVQQDRRFWVSGYYDLDVSFGGRLTENGQRDLSFWDADPRSARAIGLQSDGSIIAFAPVSVDVLRLDQNGTVDPSFGPAFVEGSTVRGNRILGGTVLADNTILVVYQASRDKAAFAKFRANGHLDESFHGPGLIGVPLPPLGGLPVVPQQDGKVLVGGFGAVLGAEAKGIIRLLPDGKLDASFHPEIGSGSVGSISLQEDNKMIVAGRFIVPASSRNNLIRLNPDGSLDASFIRTFIPENESGAIAVLQRDGKVLVATQRTPGDVAPWGPATLCRLNPDGGLDATFHISETDAEIHQMALQSDEKLLVAGRFTRIDGVARQRLVRIQLDPPLRLEIGLPGATSTVPLSVRAVRGNEYILESSSNLKSWFPLSTNLAITDSLSFAEADAFRSRFYRARKR